MAQKRIAYARPGFEQTASASMLMKKPARRLYGVNGPMSKDHKIASRMLDAKIMGRRRSAPMPSNTASMYRDESSAPPRQSKPRRGFRTDADADREDTHPGDRE